ncbi:HPr family phosphocarrier protein [Naasia lichenicola]|uniref:Phosphocarrier protein HPr n=1 Tax=Naasia lichenicola TaxID=2565933 RepID=A0A4V3WSW9_9MICO|nr:HPr family phosphocarrier protein [Naasia lichenicola]THG29727.1 HPr family phosphocarrier protein [Naasia lichenicola]
MPTRTVVVASSHGLHARPAALFSQAAAKAGVPVQLTKGGKTVNAASILGVISLGIDHNDEVVISVDGDGADELLDQLTELLTTDHDA